MNTKTNFLSLFTAGFLAISGIANAQSGFTVGAHAGVNTSKLCCGSMVINDDYKFNVGPAAGVMSEYNFNKNFSIVAELNFTTMGGLKNGMQAVNGYGTNGTLYADYKAKTYLNYLELPVMARYTLGNKIRYYADLGIFGSYLLGAKQKNSGSSALYMDKEGKTKYNSEGTPVSFNSDADIKSQVTNFNFGLVGGLGIGYTFGKHGLWLDGRYVMGMPNIRKNTAVNGENSTGSIMTTVGYTYSFNRK